MQTSHASQDRPGAGASSWAGPRGNGRFLEIAQDVVCLPLSLVNLYFFGKPGAGDRGWVLIDAGVDWATSTIVAAAEERFGRNNRPAAIVVTHGHFDHVGALPALAEHWQAPMFAHELELPYLTGRSSYPPADPAVGGTMSFMSRFFPRGPFNLGPRLHPLPPDGSVPAMPGWRWIHTPGHAPGHVSFFRDSDRTLIVGDAFVTQKQESALGVLTRMQHVYGPPAYFTPDWTSARRSVETLAQLRPEIGAAGHGIPMYGETLRQQLNALVRNWDELAQPRYGRYVNKPALMDQRGLVWAPPPVFDPQLLVAAGIGMAALAGTYWLTSGSSRRQA